ncbi:MAG: T9SS type A sorting domain-containing protein [Bacteroidota bacterium]
MRTLSTLLLGGLLITSAFAQSTRQHAPHQIQTSHSIKLDLLNQALIAPSVAPDPANPIPPFGTSAGEAVTSVKVGEASNAFTAISHDCNQLSVETEVGTNGGTVAYVSRQNIGPCGGQNGQYRFTYSTDGGSTWNVGAGTNTPGNPAATGCYGFGPVNPAHFQASRYPNGIMFLPPDSAALESELAVVYSGPTLSINNGQLWDGVVAGTSFLSDPGNPSQEDYLFVGDSSYFSYSLTERISGEFWFVGTQFNRQPGPAFAFAEDVFVYKGIFNPATQEVDWEENTRLTPDHYLGFDGAATIPGSFSIAFSPDGNTGYIAGIGDLNGGFDSTYSVWFSKSTDGGANWGAPTEVFLGNSFDLVEYLQLNFISTDTLTGDTVDISRGIPTAGFDVDMVVDKNGVPHAITVLGNATIWDGGSYSPPIYSIVNVIDMWVIDWTIDSFGDYTAQILDYQAFFRGSFGAGTDPGSVLQVDPFVQASRTEDGSKVFFLWTDTDSVNSVNGNDAPDLFLKGMDVDSYTLTPTVNLTADDPTWKGAILTPKVSPITLDQGGTYTVPALTMSLDNNDGLQPVSFWYFTDATVSDADFTEDAVFLYNCKQTPFANSVAISEPDCGASNGDITITPGGAIAPYSFQWDSNVGNATSPNIANLAAGAYSVIVTDSVGCTETMEVLVENADAPDLIADSTADISCNGFGNGYAAIAISGGQAPFSYVWSNGETDSIAVNLPIGTNTLQVTDANSCIAFIQIIVNEPAPLNVSATATGTQCDGDSTGTAHAIGTGGIGMIDYSWSNGAIGAMIDGLSGGLLTVTATDENDCIATFEVNVPQPDPVAISFDNITGNTGDGSFTFPFSGSISASVSGGTPPYDLVWDGPGDIDSVATDFLRELCSGEYTLTVTDANNCMASDTATVESLGPFADSCNTVGIDELKIGIGSLHISPNPTTGAFKVGVNLLYRDNINIEIFNIASQKILTHQITDILASAVAFDLASHPRGIYLVKVHTSKGSITKKIVVR